MKPTINRPDTPLAATPDPQPVSSGLQPSMPLTSMPTNKYQATADAAIKQVGEIRATKQQPQQQ
jgi:hypothetical protein